MRSVFETRDTSAKKNAITFLEGCEVIGIKEAEDSVTVLFKVIDSGIIKSEKVTK